MDSEARIFVREAKISSYKNIPPPFNPPEKYPEYEFGGQLCKNNVVYEKIRLMLYDMGFDRPNFGKKNWNPISDLVIPDSNILIKPNFVLHWHKGLNADPEALTTHGSFVRVITDYCLKALAGGKGHVIIADAPIQGTDFRKLLDDAGINKMRLFYEEHILSDKIRCYDLRLEKVKKRTLSGVPIRMGLSGDPSGYVSIDLGHDSEFSDIDPKVYPKFRVTQYKPSDMSQFHQKGYHSYVISKTLLDANLVINLPKLKTHKYAGLTNAMKAFIGICGLKECLPHFTIGDPTHQGDEYPNRSRRKRWITWCTDFCNEHPSFLLRNMAFILRVLIGLTARIRPFPDNIKEGRWKGNKTIDRTIVDVLKCVLFGDGEGKVHNTKQRTVLNLTDGIVAGEGPGPLEPKKRELGLIIGAIDPVRADVVAADLMGYDPASLRVLKRGLRPKGFKLTEMVGFSDVDLFVEGEKVDYKKWIEENKRYFLRPEGWN